jgi:DNA-binding XRE family transcriptional regulator
MSANPRQEAHAYAERIRNRLAARLKEAREAAGFRSQYALAKHSGVSREMINGNERGKFGKSGMSLFVAAKLAYGMRMKLRDLVALLEDE